MAARAVLIPPDDEGRRRRIVDVLVGAVADLMTADAFRTEFRQMAADPFASHRDLAGLSYADLVTTEDRWCVERASRVWIRGDLHGKDVGTYLGGQAVTR